jgi:ribosomal protein S27AE
VRKGKVYGRAPKKCPKCGSRMRSTTEIGNGKMLEERHVCPECGAVVQRVAKKMNFPDRI